MATMAFVIDHAATAKLWSRGLEKELTGRPILTRKVGMWSNVLVYADETLHVRDYNLLECKHAQVVAPPSPSTPLTGQLHG